MALSQLSDMGPVFPKLTGFLRSSHAVLVVLALACLSFFYLSKDAPALVYVAYGSFILFGVLLLIVAIRFLVNGPEADRHQSVVTITHAETRIVNIEPAIMGVEFLTNLMKEAVRFRQPLPAPSGIVQGPASDPASIKEISADEAERLKEEDLGQQRLIE